MYTEYKTDSDNLHVMDDKGKIHHYPNKKWVMIYLNNTNNIEMLKKIKSEIVQLKLEVPKDCQKKYSRNCKQLSASLYMVIIFSLIYCLTKSGIVANLLWLSGLLMMKSSFILYKNKHIMKLRHFNEISVELNETIEDYNEINRNIHTQYDQKIVIPVGDIGYNSILENKYKKDIEELRRYKDLILEIENQRKTDKKSHQKVLK